MFNAKFLQLSNSGILEMIYKKWFDWLDNKESEKHLEDELVEGVNSLGFENILFPFAIALMGMNIAVILVILEKIFDIIAH